VFILPYYYSYRGVNVTETISNDIEHLPIAGVPLKT